MPEGWYTLCPERTDHMSKIEVEKVTVKPKVKPSSKDQNIRLEKHNGQLLQDNEKEGHVTLREIIPVAEG